MKLLAQFEIPGAVHIVGADADPPRDKVVLRPAADRHDARGGDLFIGGVQVAEQTHVLNVDAERVFDGAGQPVETLVHKTTVGCVVEFQSYEDVPF